MPKIPFFGRGNKGNPGPANAGGPPFANDPGHRPDEAWPTDQLLGHTAPPPDVAASKPRIGVVPTGASGRANFYGLPQWDELNPKLIGTQGLRLFDEMYRTDSHLRRLVLAAWSPVVAGTWTLEPYGGEEATDLDREIADTIWWLLTEWMSPNFFEHLLTLGPVLMRFGFAPFEMVNWQVADYNGKQLLAPKKLEVRMPWSVWRWWQDDYGDLTHIGQILPNKADVVIPINDLVYYRLQAEGDNWMGVSLLRHAYKHWYLKDKFERLDAVGQERRAVGVPIVYHSPDVPKDQLDGVEAALASMHMSEVAYLMFPGWKMGQAPADAMGNQWSVDVIQYDSSSGPGIQTSIDYHQGAIAASFLTDFLELGHHQVGARATAEVQEDPFLTAINGALLPPVVPPLNRFIDMIRQTNWKGANGSPRLKLTLTDQASLSEIATYVLNCVQAEAMQPDTDLEDWLRNYAGLPAANADQRAMRQAAQEAAMKNAAAAAELPPGDQQPPGQQQGQTVPPADGKSQPASPPAKPGQQPPPDATPDKRPPLPAAKRLELDAPTPMPGKPVAGGVIVHAADTGRVLVTQRAPDDTDDPHVFSRFEFPGGKLDGGVTGRQGESAWTGALREWQEETGSQLPGSAEHVGQFDSPDGRYRAFVVRVPEETDVPIGHGDRGEVAQTAWRDVGSLANGRMAPRAQKLLPGLHRLLDDAPLSGGTSGADGLQMVPEVLGGEKCTCEVKDGEIVKRSASCPVHAHDIHLDDSAAEPTAKWFERLLSQDQLREAFDGCRDHVQAAVGPAAMLVAQKMAHQAANSSPPTSVDHSELAEAFTKHYADLYQLGRDTVHAELAKQRAALGKTLDDPADTLGTGGSLASRLNRARQRGEHSAQNIVNQIAEVLGRQQITGLQKAPALQTAAEQAANGQLRMEALANTTAMVNDGRNDAGSNTPDVAGAYYTSVLDATTCGPCEQADDGTLLSPEDAVPLGPPNPDCDGADRCRCALIWVLSDDPAALQAVT